jgi:hypothetical protein
MLYQALGQSPLLAGATVPNYREPFSDDESIANTKSSGRRIVSLLFIIKL